MAGVDRQSGQRSADDASTSRGRVRRPRWRPFQKFKGNAGALQLPADANTRLTDTLSFCEGRSHGPTTTGRINSREY